LSIQFGRKKRFTKWNFFQGVGLLPFFCVNLIFRWLVWRKDRPWEKSHFFGALFLVNGMDIPSSNLTQT
jgi:hypothetical protein